MCIFCYAAEIRPIHSAIWCLALFGCMETVPIQLPDRAADARSMLMMLEDGLERRLIAADLGANLPPFTSDSDGRITLLLYTRTLEELAFEPGEVDLSAVVPGSPTRGIPIADFAYESDVVTPSWNQIIFDSLDFSDIQILVPSFSECVAKGGCYVAVDQDRVCRAQCPIDAPEPPVLPERAPCDPPSIESEVLPGVFLCEPPDPVSCAAGSAQWFGAAECAPLSSCPAGDFASDLPADRPQVMVRTDAELTAALGGAGPRTVIALAKGTYAGPIDLPADVALWGACAGETIISADPIAIRSDAGGGLHGLQVRGTLSIAAGTLEVGAVELEDVVVEAGVITGAVLRIDKRGAVALDARANGRALLTDVVLEGDGTGVLALASGRDASIELASFRLVGGEIAAQARESGRIRMSRGVAERFGSVGASSEGAMTLLELDRVLIRDRRELVDRSYFENGIRALETGTVIAERVRITRLDARSIWAADSSSIRVEDLILTEIAIGAENGCVHSQNLSLVELEKAAVSGCGGPAVLVTESSATLTDLFVAGSDYGLVADGSAAHPVQLERVLVEGSTLMGICAAGSKVIGASNLVVHSTEDEPDAICGGTRLGGVGVGLTIFAQLTATRFSLAQNRVGLGVLGTNQIQLSNGELVSNRVGIYASGALDLRTSLDRVRFEGNVQPIDLPID